MKVRQQTGFTLVELMVVVLMMAILVAVGIPAISSFRATAVSSGARGVSNTLNLARQYAITHRTDARVVFFYSGTPTSQEVMDKRYRTYGVVARTNSLLMAWAQVGRWETLPMGAVFGNMVAPTGALDTQLRTANNFDYGFGGKSVAYIEFKSTGVANPRTGNTGTISVYEGVYDKSIRNIHYLPTGDAATANRIDITYDNLVGHIRIVRQ
jgi:prepilin-type N-terminal cleavage/methylation domain-containing protein